MGFRLYLYSLSSISVARITQHLSSQSAISTAEESARARTSATQPVSSTFDHLSKTFKKCLLLLRGSRPPCFPSLSSFNLVPSLLSRLYLPPPLLSIVRLLLCSLLYAFNNSLLLLSGSTSKASFVVAIKHNTLLLSVRTRASSFSHRRRQHLPSMIHTDTSATTAITSLAQQICISDLLHIVVKVSHNNSCSMQLCRWVSGLINDQSMMNRAVNTLVGFCSLACWYLQAI